METTNKNDRNQRAGKKTSKRLVYIVDDNKIFATVLKENLNHIHDLEIMVFTSGEECLKQMHLKPSLVILDFDLNGGNHQAMNGIKVLGYIKKISPETEVIMLSSWDDIDVAVASMKFGAFDYVIKNENAILSLKNKIKNVFKKFDIVQQLKEERVAKWVALLVLAITTVWAVFSDKLMGSI